MDDERRRKRNEYDTSQYSRGLGSSPGWEVSRTPRAWPSLRLRTETRTTRRRRQSPTRRPRRRTRGSQGRQSETTVRDDSLPVKLTLSFVLSLQVAVASIAIFHYRMIDRLTKTIETGSSAVNSTGALKISPAAEIIVAPASLEGFRRARTIQTRRAERGLRFGRLVVPFDYSFPFPFVDSNAES